MEIFERLIPSLRLAHFVHLQGWGEPLLHPDLLRMVELAKNAGCRVGLTTNGVLLNDTMARRLISAGLDNLAVSIAGATPSTHDATRVGSNLSTIVANLSALAHQKMSSASDHPKIALLYMMLRSNIQELPLSIDLAHKAGVQEVVATNLDYLSTSEHDAAKAFSIADADPAKTAIIDEVKSRAEKLGVEFRHYPLAAQEDTLVCEAVAGRTAFIGVDGSMFPCVYLSIPVDPIPRFFRGERYDVPRLPFGNLATTDLDTIWKGEKCKSFYRAFDRRRDLASYLSMEQVLGREFSWAPANSASNAGQMILGQIQDGAPLPEQCRTCYKAYGL